VLVGLIYDRTHTREIAEMSGLMHRMPLVGTVFVIAGLASLGMPGTSGFVAELTTFLGSFAVHPVATAGGIFGVVLSAGYILWTVQRVLHGPPSDRWRGLTDATAWWEVTAMASLVIVILAVGVYPALLTRAVEAGIAPIAQILGDVS
jgi:NADH-quinone oxidoreductase subunit M